MKDKILASTSPAVPEAQAVLDKITTTLQRLGKPETTLHIVTDNQDQTIWFELFGPKRRLGFVCDPIPTDSSWYWVSTVPFGSDSGPMSNVDYEALIRWLLAPTTAS